MKHNYWEKADIELISRSCTELVAKLDEWNNSQHVKVFPTAAIKRVYLPRPGCGCGRLMWTEDVQPIISELLDDRVAVITF